MRNRLLKIFFIAASLLLLAHLISDFFILEKTFGSEQEEKLISTEDLLLTLFDDYGIQSSWINKVTSRRKIDTLTTEYRVQLPPDIPVPLVIRDIQSLFNDEVHSVSASESEINGKSIVTISSTDDYRIITEFVRNRNIKRDGINIAFIIDGFTNLKRIDLNNLLDSKIKYCVLLSPVASNETMAGEILRTKKEYALYLSADIREIAFKLDKNYSKLRLRDSFLNMLNTFPNVKLFVYEDSPEFMTPLLYDVMNTFSGNNNIKLIPVSRLNNELNDLETAPFNYLINKNNEVFITNGITFLSNYNELFSFRKKGNKVLFPSELIK